MSEVKNKQSYKTAKSLMAYGKQYTHIAVLLFRNAYWGKP